MKYVISGDRAYVSINGATTFVQKDCDPHFHEIVAAIRNEDVEEVKRLILIGEAKLGNLLSPEAVSNLTRKPCTRRLQKLTFMLPRLTR